MGYVCRVFLGQDIENLKPPNSRFPADLLEVVSKATTQQASRYKHGARVCFDTGLRSIISRKTTACTSRTMTNYYHARKGHLIDGHGMGVTVTKTGKDHRMFIKLSIHQKARTGKHPLRHGCWPRIKVAFWKGGEIESGNSNPDKCVWGIKSGKWQISATGTVACAFFALTGLQAHRNSLANSFHIPWKHKRIKMYKYIRTNIYTCINGQIVNLYMYKSPPYQFIHV